MEDNEYNREEASEKAPGPDGSPSGDGPTAGDDIKDAGPAEVPPSEDKPSEDTDATPPVPDAPAGSKDEADKGQEPPKEEPSKDDAPAKDESAPDESKKDGPPEKEAEKEEEPPKEDRKETVHPKADPDHRKDKRPVKAKKGAPPEGPMGDEYVPPPFDYPTQHYPGYGPYPQVPPHYYGGPGGPQDQPPAGYPHGAPPGFEIPPPPGLKKQDFTRDGKFIPHAGLGYRIVGYFIDFIIVFMITNLIAAYLWADVTEDIGFSDKELNNFMESQGSTIFLVLAFFYSFLIFYFFIFESVKGWTPGKRMLGLTVVRKEDLSKASPAQCGLRALPQILYFFPVPVIFLIIDCVMVWVGRQKIGDYIARTYVVKKPKVYYDGPPGHPHHPR